MTASDTTINGINYGPLAGLVGNWSGDSGLDKTPEPDGLDDNPFYETLMFEAIGDVTNAESQTLAVLRYHQIVYRKSNQEVFHNETGYWMWDSATDGVMQSLTIPRGVALLAGGKAISGNDGSVKIDVEASVDSADWGIVQSPFMRDKAKTQRFTHTIEVQGDKLKYSETTVVDIYGKVFDHSDANELVRSK